MNQDNREDKMNDTVATLVRAAGRRSAPPDIAYQTVLAAAESVLDAKLRSRRRRRIGAWLGAAAATLVAALALMTQMSAPTAPAVVVARMDRVDGIVETRARGASAWNAVVADGRRLMSGTRLRTRPAAGAGLILDSGVSVRIAANTEVVLREAAGIELLQGVVYADTDGSDSGRLVVMTPAGAVHDVGTQFEVRYVDAALRLRVREGRVLLQRESDRLVASAGEQLAVTPQGEYERAALAPEHPDWAWAEALAPAPTIDGRPVSFLLEWVARETGRRVQYRDDTTAMAASSTVLHGKVGHLTPLAALDVMLATTDLAYTLRGDGTIEVHQK